MIISVDDGGASDVRIAALARKYNVQCVFYWPVEWHSLAYEKGYEPLSFLQALEIARDFEIGSHTVTHRYLTQIRESEAKNEIEESKVILQNMFKQPIKKFAPPRGYTNDVLTEFTLRFYEKQRLTKGKGLVHIHPNSGANDNRPWQQRITKDTEELWCHSWELDKYDLWEELEDFLSSPKVVIDPKLASTYP